VARKIAQYTVTDEGRDKGKLFLLTEMSAAKAEAWATRVLLALIGNNVSIPENYQDMGMAALAELGLKAISGLKWETAEPLLAEMMECVKIIPKPSKPEVFRPLIDSDIEEILTRFRLRIEVWKLHMDFLQAVVPSFSKDSKTAVANTPLPTMQTSPDPSESLFPAV
jgi:hypothetical protein